MVEPLDVTGKKTAYRFTPTDTERELAATIRKKREDKRLDQAELARLIGVSSRTLMRIENVQRPVKLGVLNRIEELLGPCRRRSQDAGTEATVVRESPSPQYGSTVVSDPHHSLGAQQQGEGGYTVKYTETDYIARELDAIEDKATRMRVMKFCMDAISEALHPSRPGAHKSGSASRRSST